MTTDEQKPPGGAGSGDLLRDLALGLADQIDQLTALIMPQRGSDLAATGRPEGPGAATAPPGDGSDARLTDLLGEVGTLVGEIGDQIARLLSTLIAVLEAIARALSSAPTTGPAAESGFQSIPVRLSATHPDPARATRDRSGPDGESR